MRALFAFVVGFSLSVGTLVILDKVESQEVGSQEFLMPFTSPVPPGNYMGTGESQSSSWYGDMVAGTLSITPIPPLPHECYHNSGSYWWDASEQCYVRFAACAACAPTGGYILEELMFDPNADGSYDWEFNQFETNVLKDVVKYNSSAHTTGNVWPRTGD